jgi:DNA invertase Pin-like site-specific DNA recombinase
MKTLIFARVSTKEQEDGHSLDAQIQSYFEYAIKKNFKVIEQFKVVESSTALGRPEFSKMVITR